MEVLYGFIKMTGYPVSFTEERGYSVIVFKIPRRLADVFFLGFLLSSFLYQHVFPEFGVEKDQQRK